MSMADVSGVLHSIRDTSTTRYLRQRSRTSRDCVADMMQELRVSQVISRKLLQLAPGYIPQVPRLLLTRRISSLPLSIFRFFQQQLSEETRFRNLRHIFRHLDSSATFGDNGQVYEWVNISRMPPERLQPATIASKQRFCLQQFSTTKLVKQ